MINEEIIRKIVREELQTLFATDRITLQKNIQIFDGRNIQLGRTSGTKIGTAIDQKMGFYGATPADKPETVNDPSGAGTEGVDSSARTAINTIIDRLQELGLIK